MDHGDHFFLKKCQPRVKLRVKGDSDLNKEGRPVGNLFSKPYSEIEGCFVDDDLVAHSTC